MSPNRLIFITSASYLILLSLLSTQSLAAANNSTSTSYVTPKALCKYTPDPSYCRSILPNETQSNLYDYGRFSVRKSLSQARKFIYLVDRYLRLKSKLSKPAFRALEDCRFLAGLNMDFLLTSFQTVSSTTKVLSNIKAEDIQTLLSAILTNQQTCLDGIQATASSWTIKNGISIPLSNNTKLYSVSLALFTKGWVPKIKKKVSWKPTKKQLAFSNGRLPLKMNSKTRAIYESLSRRKLLQSTSSDDVVVVSDIVSVSQDGSGNFTTIYDAIVAAPNNSVSSDGYFLIYVKAGVYEEYVNIAKNKRNLMMIGDGINQTIITGNRSVVDGWTTFNSATFGKFCFAFFFGTNTDKSINLLVFLFG